MSQGQPFLVEPDWTSAVFIPNTLGPSYRILRYGDGSARFEHRCREIDGVQLVVAPLLRLNEPYGHRIVQTAPLTIEPSIACPDCDTHGFIRKGRWVAA